MLSYSESPAHNSQASQWSSPVQKFNIAEFATSSAGGSRSEASWFPRSTERQYASTETAASPYFASPSSLSESGNLESTSRQPLPIPNRNVTIRNPFISKAVYPLVFHNPVSDCETFGDADASRLTPGNERVSPSMWPDNSSSVEHKFQKTLSNLQKLDTSPDQSASSRREGFRWSSASSFEIGFDGETVDMGENMDVESLRSPIGPMGGQKCGICGKLLWQKSPWSSQLIRNGDMPITGILPCSHVFHADCLEQMTPKTQISEPPCLLCLKTTVSLDSVSFSEPLQMALRSVRRSRVGVTSEPLGNHHNDDSRKNLMDRLKRTLSSSVIGSGSSLKHRLKKNLTFKGKMSMQLVHRFRSSSGKLSIQ